MNNHKKIDWFRWHQRKLWIRINCAILCAILLITLLLQYPIISNAESSSNSSKLGNYYTINQTYNQGQGLIYANTTYPNYQYFEAFFNYGPFSDGNNTYASDIKAVFESDYDFQSDLGNTPLGSVNLYFFTLNGSDDLRFCFNTTCLVRGNWSKSTPEYYETQFAQSSSYKLYKIVNGEVSYDSTLASASSYKALSVNNIVTATGGIYVHGQNNMDVNYLTANGDCGNFAGGVGITPPLDDSILDNEYIGENSFMYGDGVSINQWNLIVGLDFNESQMKDISKYHYILDCTLQANYTLAKGLTRNQETSLLQSYGLQWASNNRNVVTMDFSKTYTDTLSSNYFTIPSTVFNDGLLCDGYTAVPLVNYIATYVPKGSTTNEIQSFFIAMSNVNVGPFSLPGYNETEWFNNCTISYNFSMNVYNENDDLITSLPLAMSYNPMTGQQDNYSNGGGKSKNEVQQTINQNNENKTPEDPDYKDPQDYTPTINPNNNDNSSNSNSNSSSNSSPTIYNNASITLPKTETYPTTGLMRSFVRIINNDKNDTVEDLDNITGASSYIALMNNALTVIPQQVWNIWIISLKALFGIVISAFFLKILINWAT